MLHHKFRQLLTITYYHMLSYGLLPATLHFTKGQLDVNKYSTGYLIYSFCVTGLSLLSLLFLTPKRIFSDYMENNIVIQASLLVKFAIRLLAYVSCYLLVWLKRHSLIQLYKDFFLHWSSSWSTLRRIAGIRALHQLQMELAVLLRRNLYVNYGLVSCTVLMHFQLLNRASLILHFMSLVQMIFFLVVRIGFVTMLVLLVHQFKAVQLALQNLSNPKRKSRSKENLRRISDIHTECKILARRAFRIYDIANACIFLNMFVMNINILYHAVQFGNKTIKSDLVGIIVGDGLIISNFWSTVIVLNMVDYTVNSCNNTGQLLRPFSTIQRLSAEIQMELEIFTTRLRHNHLVYKMCECVVINKPACLSYMASVASHVIILMQFDLRLQQEKNVDCKIINLSS